MFNYTTLEIGFKKSIMNDLDWEYDLLIIISTFSIYLLIAFISYGLILSVGNGIKRRLEKTIWKEKETFSILNLVSIYFPIALSIQFVIKEVLIFLAISDESPITLFDSLGGSYVIEIVFFYLSVWLSSLEVVGMILLRQKYNRNGIIIDRENWGKRVTKIWLWLLIMLGIRFFFRTSMNYYSVGNSVIYWGLWIIQIGITGGIIYLMIKYWNSKSENE
jgi:hypothetical protein